jgi:hypothetical protein
MRQFSVLRFADLVHARLNTHAQTRVLTQRRQISRRNHPCEVGLRALFVCVAAPNMFVRTMNRRHVDSAGKVAHSTAIMSHVFRRSMN